MTREEEAIKGLKSFVEVRRKYGDMQTIKDEIECLEMAVKVLEQQSCEDAISREDALMALTGEWTDETQVDEVIHRCIKRIKALPSVQPESDWIPIKYHQATEEEIEEERYPFDVTFILDNYMPDDEQEILITTKYENKRTGQVIYSVDKDVCYYDDGYLLDSGYDWITDVVAWREMPEPYKVESEDKE